MAVVATLVVGQDGSTTKAGRSAGVTSTEDRELFLQRRRTVDAIIIGGNTARNEPYRQTPVPLIVISRSQINPVPENHQAHLWNCSAPEAIERAITLFGNNLLIEGGRSIIIELIAHNLIDELELSVTTFTGGEEKIDFKKLLASFSQIEKREVPGTTFYSARN